jgi:hypothetical protein
MAIVELALENALLDPVPVVGQNLGVIYSDFTLGKEAAVCPEKCITFK